MPFRTRARGPLTISNYHSNHAHDHERGRSNHTPDDVIRPKCGEPEVVCDEETRRTWYQADQGLAGREATLDLQERS